jgi:hypothetical protein
MPQRVGLCLNLPPISCRGPIQAVVEDLWIACGIGCGKITCRGEAYRTKACMLRSVYTDPNIWIRAVL